MVVVKGGGVGGSGGGCDGFGGCSGGCADGDSCEYWLKKEKILWF